MANKANLANSVLFAPLSDSDTTLEVYTGDGLLFPAAPFYLTISPKNKWSRKINSEIVLVTAKSTDTFTITRAQKGTTAKAFDYGDLVANGIYKEDMDDIATDYNAAIASAISAAKQALMPVGTIVVLGVSTNPNTLYGFGTWTAIAGRVLVGLDGTQAEFDTLNETGGHKKLQAHWHKITSRMNVTTGANGGSAFGILQGILNGVNHYSLAITGVTNSNPEDTSVAVGALPTGEGDGENLQPYIVKYMWQRTA